MLQLDAKLITCNDCGDREVQLTYPARWWGWVPERVRVLVSPQNGGTVWCEKGTGARATPTEVFACLQMIEWNRQQEARELREAMRAEREAIEGSKHAT